MNMNKIKVVCSFLEGDELLFYVEELKLETFLCVFHVYDSCVLIKIQCCFKLFPYRQGSAS